ncbi:FkbM family methyltransferase [Candidatus Pacebacteria bacterium]|nr:FkbM family methyltransferase [Candidatus Paceibacterota bacterium]
MLIRIYSIVKKKHLSFHKRTLLAGAYIKIRILRFCIGRFISPQKIKKISALGYVININGFDDFYWTFLEVFIEEEYYFLTDESSPTILDLGGHIGVTVLYFKWLYPDANITVFEPLQENNHILEKNVTENKLTNIILEKKAVGGSTGTRSFYGEGRAGFVGNDTAADVEVVNQVSVTILSEYITDTITFCKMDIEGSEAAVIKELEDHNKLHHIKHLVMEFHKKDSSNKLSDIVASLEKVSMSVSFMSDLNPLHIKKRDFTHIMLVATSQV